MRKLTFLLIVAVIIAITFAAKPKRLSKNNKNIVCVDLKTLQKALKRSLMKARKHGGGKTLAYDEDGNVLGFWDDLKRGMKKFFEEDLKKVAQSFHENAMRNAEEAKDPREKLLVKNLKEKGYFVYKHNTKKAFIVTKKGENPEDCIQMGGVKVGIPDTKNAFSQCSVGSCYAPILEKCQFDVLYMDDILRDVGQNYKEWATY